MTAPASYDGVVLCAPFSTPYQRYSLDTGHYWISTAPGEFKARRLKPKGP